MRVANGMKRGSSKFLLLNQSAKRCGDSPKLKVNKINLRRKQLKEKLLKKAQKNQNKNNDQVSRSNENVSAARNVRLIDSLTSEFTEQVTIELA